MLIIFSVYLSSISLPVFSLRTNLKLHNISITPKIVKKVIANLDSSKVSGPDCIPVMVLKNCEPELSYILAELFNMSLVFQIVGWSHRWSLYLRMLWKGLLLKTTALLVFFSLVVKSLKNFPLTASMVLGLLNKLQIFWQLCLMELPGLLRGLGLLEQWHLIYPRLSTEFGMMVFFTNLTL